MQWFTIEIEADGGFPDRFEVTLEDREAARCYAIELASDHLHTARDVAHPMIVNSTIRDDQGNILDTIRSMADVPDHA